MRPFQEPSGKAVVLLFADPECPISNALAPEVGRICDAYVPRGVEFFLVYADGAVVEEDIEKHIELVENERSSIGDDTQLANVDLQNALQKQQQTMQLLTNASKMLHDTAMAILRKIGS